MSETRRADKLGWGLAIGLCALYLSQGVTHGIGQVLVGFQAARGAPLETQTGLLAWGALPWALKLVWSLGWDRYVRGSDDSPRRRTAALASLQVGVGACLIAFGAMGASPWLPLLYFGLNLLVSLQDVGTDALVVDGVPAQRRGFMNGAMACARALGMGVLGTLGFYAAVKGVGESRTLVGYGIGLVLLAGVILATRSAITKGERRRDWPPLSSLVSTPGRRWGLALAFMTQAGDALSSAVAYDFLIKRASWGAEALFEELAPLAVLSEVIAYALVCLIIGRLGGRKAVIFGSLALGIGWATLSAAEPLWTSHSLIKAITVWDAWWRSLMYVGVYTLLMGHTEAERRATHFVVYMTLMNLPRLLTATAAPWLFNRVGYAGVYFVSGLLALMVSAIAFAWRDAESAQAPSNT